MATWHINRKKAPDGQVYTGIYLSDREGTAYVGLTNEALEGFIAELRAGKTLVKVNHVTPERPKETPAQPTEQPNDDLSDIL